MPDLGRSTLFLRLEGPLQAWGDTSKFVIRRSMEAPTKSGLLGLICCAMGLARQAARDHLPELNRLTMGLRIDRPGTRWWDYHTVGARIGILNAKGEVKKTASTGEYETLITRREYLADASFLVALQGEATLIEKVANALRSPKWTLYLGRKSCPPSMPVFTQPRKGKDDKWTNPIQVEGGVKAALERVPWYPRHPKDAPRDEHGDRCTKKRLPCLLEWRSSDVEAEAPDHAEVWYDAPSSFDPPVHQPRLVVRDCVTVEVGDAIQQHTSPPPRPRANYKNAEWTSEALLDVVDPLTGFVTQQPKGARPRRLRKDHHLCVFCKSPATTVQHVTYRRAGGDERQDDLRSLCRLCHDAVTMIEYGLGMGLDRINPEEERWREQIIQKRDEIVRFRSLETRRRRLAPEEVE